MLVRLITDAPAPNFALMKVSAWHRARGDQVILSAPLDLEECDVSYGSWLFQQKYHTTFAGGPAVDPAVKLPPEIEEMFPDYSLYPRTDHSLAMTFAYCPRSCGWCVVPRQGNPEGHRSIYETHNPQFRKLALLSNNILADPRWLETFEEIWAEDLTLIDHNGFDLRLLTPEMAEAIRRTKFAGLIHWAWDDPADFYAIMRGLGIARGAGLQHRSGVYVLTGYNTTLGEDAGRCAILSAMDFDPYVMVYRDHGHSVGEARRLRLFQTTVNNVRQYRAWPSMLKAFEGFCRGEQRYVRAEPVKRHRRKEEATYV